MYYKNILELIGNTPLLSLEETTGCQIFAKAEFLNPGGSIKDRIALNMLAKDTIQNHRSRNGEYLTSYTENLCGD